jgi:hypothetical protein
VLDGVIERRRQTVLSEAVLRLLVAERRTTRRKG